MDRRSKYQAPCPPSLLGTKSVPGVTRDNYANLFQDLSSAGSRRRALSIPNARTTQDWIKVYTGPYTRNCVSAPTYLLKAARSCQRFG